jgi:hypothetical protein
MVIRLFIWCSSQTVGDRDRVIVFQSAAERHPPTARAISRARVQPDEERIVHCVIRSADAPVADVL